MLKLIFVLFVFCLIVATIKPTPSVKELTEVNKIYCKDICK
jgi:hypothetical protein